MSTNNYKIYKITNIITNKVYIGVTRRTIEKRFENHIKQATNSKYKKYKLHRSIAKHGAENFKIENICEGFTREEAMQKEVEYIALFDSFHHGYNSTTGGETPSCSRGRSHWTEKSCKSFKESRKKWLETEEGKSYRSRASERFKNLNPQKFVTTQGRISAAKKYKEWIYNTEEGVDRRKQSSENMKKVQKSRHNGTYKLLSPDGKLHTIQGDILIFCQQHKLSFHSFYYALTHNTKNTRGPNAGWVIIEWNIKPAKN